MVKGDSIVDVSAVVQDIPHSGPGDLISGLIARFDAYRGKLEAASAGTGVALSGVRLRPPLPKPGNIVCMAVNYMENGTLAKPAPINAFPQGADSDYRTGRYHGASRCPRHDLRGRGGNGVGDRQARYQCPGLARRWTISSATSTS